MNPNLDGFGIEARAYRKSLGPKMDMLTPHAGSILSMRKRGASYPDIMTLLRKHGIEVSVDTVRDFCMRLAKDDSSSKPPETPPPTPTPLPAQDIRPPVTTVPVEPYHYTAPAVRGPRIYDPRTL